MIIITSKNEESRVGWYAYQMAGQRVLSQFALSGLDSFLLQKDFKIAALPDNHPADYLQEAESIYQGMAPFEGRLQSVECLSKASIVQINVSDRPVCQVDFDNNHIALLDDDLLGSQLALEVLTGPAMVLLLAQKGVFCMHASAVTVSGDNVMFVAESGVGKSTISVGEDDDWQQLADDILPIGYSEKGVRALVDYPQLKLADAVSPSFNFKQSRVDLDVIIRLSETSSDDIVFTELNSQKAMLQVIRHTVGAKLFDNQQLQRHMSFAKKLVSKVPVFELAYPRDLSQLSHLQDTISVFLATRS